MRTSVIPLKHCDIWMVFKIMAPRDFPGYRLCIDALLDWYWWRLMVSYRRKEMPARTITPIPVPAVYLMNATISVSLARMTVRAITVIRFIKAKSWFVCKTYGIPLSNLDVVESKADGFWVKWVLINYHELVYGPVYRVPLGVVEQLNCLSMDYSFRMFPQP